MGNPWSGDGWYRSSVEYSGEESPYFKAKAIMTEDGDVIEAEGDDPENNYHYHIAANAGIHSSENCCDSDCNEEHEEYIRGFVGWDDQFYDFDTLDDLIQAYEKRQGQAPSGQRVRWRNTLASGSDIRYWHNSGREH